MRRLFLLSVCCILSYSSMSQNVTDIFQFRDRELYFFGIDFSGVKLVGSKFSNTQEIKDVFFGQWNSILASESKYDLKGPLHRRNIVTDFSAVEKRNKDVDASSMMVYNQRFMTLDQITGQMEMLDFGERTGNGLIFIADLFDWEKNKAVIHIVFFDIATKKILLHEAMRGNPSGVGTRNFWANAIADIISKIADVRYKEWEQMFFK